MPEHGLNRWLFLLESFPSFVSFSALQAKLKSSIIQVECAQKDLSQVITLDEVRKAAREGLDTKNTAVSNSTPVASGTLNSTSIPSFPTTGMEPVCTAADLPIEVRRHILLTITEENEEDYDNEDQNCGNSCGHGNDCCQTGNVPGNNGEDDDDEVLGDVLDDYPFDY